VNLPSRRTPGISKGNASSPTKRDGRLALRIGRRLRRRRQELRLTLASVAELASISTSYLSAVEKGSNLPSLPVLARVTEALGTTIPNVLAEEGANLARRGRLPSPGDGIVSVTLSHPDLQLEVVAVAAPGLHNSPVPLPTSGRDVFAYLLVGELKVSVGEDDPIALSAGDALDLRSESSVALSAEGGSISIWSSCPVRR
jgi:transcriptional regulator with XRE-family HTH domain